MDKTNPATNQNNAQSPYASFLKESMVPVREEVQERFNQPFAWGTFPDLQDMNTLEELGDMPVETGYSVAEDGSVTVAVKTPMPNTTPQMWDWWFGWHGSEDARYQLWHPKAHLTAEWEDGRTDHCYIGRNSVIKEYIGKNLLDALIQFKSPIDFGFSAASINQKEDAVYICARIGHPTFPVDFGYLVHQVRKTPTGTEMRSRFWLGGKYVSARNDNFLNKAAVKIMQTFQGLPKNFGQDMLLHCSEEMTHLASILPDLYNEYAEDAADTISGNTIHQGDAHFEKAVLDTVWSKTPVDRRPASIYEPKTVEDIINIVRHAKKVGRRITITSGGHSFSANFLRDDCLLIDMKHFNQFEVNTEEKTAVAGPGVGGSDLMKALYKMDLFFPAGHCQGVCLGGYLLQGGYGWNGRKLGIACESVLGMDLVTADGEFVHADANTNPDLYWAARGSGAGFFGMVNTKALRLAV